jgi:hypothetical protein
LRDSAGLSPDFPRFLQQLITTGTEYSFIAKPALNQTNRKHAIALLSATAVQPGLVIPITHHPSPITKHQPPAVVERECWRSSFCENRVGFGFGLVYLKKL